MQRSCPEVFYQRALALRLFARGFQVREEVRFGVKRFDTIAYDGAKIYGFEVKLRVSKRSIRQAAIYQVACDYVYLVVPEASSPNDAMRERCHELGIGIITLGDPPYWAIRTILTARLSKAKSSRSAESILSYAEFGV
jgi:predicted RecB family endonuclease